MKYFDKEYWHMLDLMELAETLKPMADNELTPSALKQFTGQMEEQFLKDAEGRYDTPPVNLADFTSPDDFNPEEYTLEDENGDVRHPDSYEEYKAYCEKLYQNQMEQFKNRPDFDRDAALEELHKNMEAYKEELPKVYPDYVIKSVDPLFLALGFCPQGVYEKLQAEIEEGGIRCDRLEEAYENDPAKENLPEELSMLKSGNCGLVDVMELGDSVMLVLAPKEQDSSTLATFNGAAMLKNEVTPELLEQELYISAYEFYHTENGYELHLLVCSDPHTPYELSFRYTSFRADSAF